MTPIDFHHPLAVADHQHINYSGTSTTAETPSKVKAAPTEQL
jgi:hypothetical protein